MNVALSVVQPTIPDRADDLTLDAIRVDQRAQPRDHLDTEITKTYAEDMRNGVAFPALTVFHDGETFWLADGFHRHYAARNADLKTFRCEIRQGGLREAILYSCGANAAHGHRRSDDDKRRAVRRMLEDEDWRQWSDREIARMCRVNHGMVGKARKEMEPAIHTGVAASMAEPADNQRTFVHHKTGKPSTMDTGAIGKPNGSNRKGPRLSTPDGMATSTHIRCGLKLEADGAGVDAAAKQIGIGTQSYRRARDVVLLAERDDLGSKDGALASQALSILDETKQVGKAHDLIGHLVLRMWGAQGAQRNIGRETQRVEAFKNAISVIVEACETGSEIMIPHLSRDQASAALKELRSAEGHIRALKIRIEDMHQ